MVHDIYPVVVEVREGEAETETLKRVKEEVRRIPTEGYRIRSAEVSDRGRGGEERRMRTLPEAEISFNYLGNKRIRW